MNKVDGESTTDFCPSTLEALSRDIEDIAKQLRKILSQKEMNSDNSYANIYAREKYMKRRKVDSIFEFEGFSQSPAWDIMLDLFEAHSQKKSISVTSACIGAACPATTALRWIQVLGKMGLILRSDDPTDKRRAIVSLTEDGWKKTAMALQLYAPRTAPAQSA